MYIRLGYVAARRAMRAPGAGAVARTSGLGAVAGAAACGAGASCGITPGGGGLGVAAGGCPVAGPFCAIASEAAPTRNAAAARAFTIVMFTSENEAPTHP
jgi:hypothetical protein